MTTPDWKDVESDGYPVCDGEKVLVGVNSAGYCACFNNVIEALPFGHNASECWYESAEQEIFVMSDLKWWKPLELPEG